MMDMGQLRKKYKLLHGQTEEGVLKRAYGAVFTSLYACSTLIDAKNQLQVYELMALPGVTQDVFRLARYQLEHEMRGQ